MSAVRTFRSTQFGAPGVMPQSLGVPAAAYPGRIAANSDLIVAVDRQQTRLALPLNSTDTSMTVVDPSTIISYSLLTIDAEIVKTTGPPTGNVIPISRGFDGTLAALHLASAIVAGFIDAYHHNCLVSEVKAIEQTLGPNLSNVPGSLTLQGGAFDFAAQVPGGVLNPGLNVISLAPVPRGVNGSNTKHYLYLSGGTGTAEAVLISGGTAVSGAASGTVIVSCANPHTGAWTISSATKGIQEAEKSLPSEGGVILLGTGTLQMRAPVSFRRNETFQGLGTATILIPASASAVVFDDNLPVHASDQYSVQRDNVTFSDFVIDGSAYAGINSVTGIRSLVHDAAEVYAISGASIISVHFNNVRNALLMQRVFDLSLTGVRTYSNSQIRLEDATDDATHNSFFVKIQDFQYVWNCMNAAACAAPALSGEAAIRVKHGELIYIVNSIFAMAGGTTGMDGIAFWGAGEDLSVVNVSMTNPRQAITLQPTTFGGASSYPGYIRLLNVSADSIWGNAVNAGDGLSATQGQSVQNVLINNCLFTNPHPSATFVSMVNIGAYGRFWNICNTQFTRLEAAYPQTGVSVAANADYIYLNGNQFVSFSGPPGGHGVFITSPSGVYGTETNLFSRITDMVNDSAQTVASAAALALPVGRTTVIITGTANITSITAPAGLVTKRVTLFFQDPGAVVTDGGSLRLAGNFTSTAFSSLSLQFILGSIWVETGRSLN